MTGVPARLAVYVTIAFAFVAPGILAGALPAFRDLLVLVVPMRLHAARAVASGELPLWTTDLFLGAPFLANYQSAVLYPPSILTYVLPEAIGLSAFLGFHLALAGWGMDAFLRARERVSPAAALLGGVAYAAGGFFASLLPLTNHLEAAAWLPWILLAAERFAESESRRSFVVLAVLLALQLLAGAPETVLLSGAIVALLLPRSARPARLLPVAAGALAAALLAVAATAAQLVPTAEYLAETDRSETLPFEVVAAESLEPRALQQLVLPHRFSDGAPSITPKGGVPLVWSVHLGAVPLVFLFARTPSAIWAGLVIVGGALALGPHLPALPLAYAAAPGIVGLFRFPAKFFLLCHVGLVVLAARGIDAGFGSGSRRCGAIAFAFAVAATVLAVAIPAVPDAALAALGYDLRKDLDDAVLAHLATGVSLQALRFALIAGSAGFALLLARRQPHLAAPAMLALAIVTAGDLVSLHHPLAGYVAAGSLEGGGPETIGLRAGERAFHFCAGGFGCKPERAPGIGTWRGTLRVAVPIEEQAAALWSSFVPNVSTIRGLGTVAGSDGLVTRSQRDLWNALVALPPLLGARLLHAYGVSALIGETALAGLPVSFSRDAPPLVVHPTDHRP